MSRPLQAVIFDFDGVIANSEPLHLTAFQQVLQESGIELTATDYYAAATDQGIVEVQDGDSIGSGR